MDEFANASPTKANKNKFHKHLKSLGIEIDEFEVDSFYKSVIQGEKIVGKHNQIESLF